MDLMLLRAFQRQVLLQCKFLVASAGEVDNGVKNRNIEQTFYALQNLLTAAANISKALWGGGGSKSAERKPLHDSIGIDDNSPLREVTMRNNFEHFDERLDRWWKESLAHNLADLSLGDKSAIQGMADIDKFRFYNPQTTDVVFWGQEFNLKKLLDEVQKLLPKLHEEANKPHWNPTPPKPAA